MGKEKNKSKTSPKNEIEDESHTKFVKNRGRKTKHDVLESSGRDDIIDEKQKQRPRDNT